MDLGTNITGLFHWKRKSQTHKHKEKAEIEIFILHYVKQKIIRKQKSKLKFGIF